MNPPGATPSSEGKDSTARGESIAPELRPGSTLVTVVGMRGFIFDLVRPYRRWLVLILAAMLASTAASVAGPWPLKIIIDNVVGQHPLPGFLTWLGDLTGGDYAHTLAALAAVAFVSIVLLGSVADYVDNYFTENVAQYVANDLRERLYHHLHRLSLRYYDTHRTASLLSTIISDVSTIQSFASSALLSILVDLLTIAGMLGVMLYLNFDFSLIAVAVAPFLLLFVTRFKRAIKKAAREVRQRQSDVLAVVQQGLESIRSVAAFGRQELEEERLHRASMEAVQAALNARRIKSLLSPIVSVTVAVCVAFVLWRGAGLILTGAMTIGALTVFLSYLSKFFSPVADLARMTTVIAEAAVGLERIRLIFDADAVIPQKPDAISPGDLKGEIVFENVSFAYEPESPVLRGVSFTVEPGQRVGICGPSGGGKSTVLSLIPRFYDPSTGRILVDGIDVADYKLDLLRSQIGFVLQDTVLFAGSIQENIAYGRPGATAGEIIEAAKMANAHEFISRAPNGYNSLVGERGMTLSGGQRQRIGIARAIVRNSPILVLDEPTAALDPASEEVVMDALDTLMAGRTVVTIAHRLSTIRDADMILVLEDGRVVETGTHHELIRDGGAYADLHRSQSQADRDP